MAWFCYLILSLNKILYIYYLVLALSGLGAKNNVSRVEGSNGIKKFEKHWF